MARHRDAGTTAHAWIGCGPSSGTPGGIWLLTLDATAGAAGAAGAATVRHVVDAQAPTFLAAHPTKPRLYAVSEAEQGAVTSYAVEPGPTLRVTGVHTSGGAHPCHLHVHPDGTWLYVSNYGDGTVAAWPLSADGDLVGEPVLLTHQGSGQNPDRQAGPHAHSAAVTADAARLVVADLGTDEIRVYPLKLGRPQAKAMTTVPLPPGFGPRHMVVEPGRLRVAGELSGEIADITLGADGARVAANRPVLADQEAVSDLSHVVRVSGGLLVAARGPSSIVLLRDGVGQRVETATVSVPRHFTVVGETLVVAGQGADSLGLHPLAADGQPGPVLQEVVVPVPMCVLPLT